MVMRFSGMRYFALTWYVYFLSGALAFVAATALMVITGTASVITVPAVGILSVMIPLLVLINRLRTWKGSTVVMNTNSVTYTRIVGSGFDYSVPLNKIKHTVIKAVSPVQRIEKSVLGTTVCGDGVRIEKKHDRYSVKEKRTPIKKMFIPAYFK